MRLYTCLTLCVCALYASAASVPSSQKKIDALDNVDFDNVEPELIDQPAVQDLDNSLRKVSDIPVKVIDVPVVLDENSNEYIPDKDENINIKRIEVDLDNPGLPQRQEHETQNPENYGERERAVYKVLQKAKEAQSIFAKGIEEVSNSFYNLNKHSDEIPAVLENVKKLNISFSNEILDLNNTIRIYLEPNSAHADEEQKNNLKLKYVESKLENLQSNFKQGVDILNEGFELLSILQEEDEAAISETKTLVKEENESIRDNAAPPTPSSSTSAPPPFQLPANGFTNFVSFFQNTVNNMLSNITSVFQPSAQKPQDTKPPGVQSDEAGSTAAPSSTSAPSQWRPQVLFQQFQNSIQNSIQNLVNGGQNNQNNQATSQPIGSISQVFQNIIQSFPRPSQVFSPQPATSSPAPQNPTNPSQSSDPPKKPESGASTQADAIPAASSVPVAAQNPAQSQVAQPAQPVAASQPVAVEQPAQGGPIQQLVQNNPVIQRIQSAVQRIQASPNSDTPRNDIVKDEEKVKDNLENKGHGSNANQVTAWTTFVTGLIGTISAAINGTALTVSTAVNSAINTIGTNVQVYTRVRVELSVYLLLTNNALCTLNF